jgi:hypothetical protein
MTVSDRFSEFLSNIRLTDTQSEDGEKKLAGVRSCLNAKFYNLSSPTANSFLIGSWARHTRVRPPRDIDVMFILPRSLYDRYERTPNNKQSQILQAVRRSLGQCFATTNMSADGQVVIVPFTTQSIEVVPCFAISNGKFRVCDTNSGGSYKDVDPHSQQESLTTSDQSNRGKTRHLVRMLKKWQDNCSVPIKSFWLELLSEDFLANWTHKDQSITHYDWMIRDFFTFLVKKAGTGRFLPNTFEYIYFGDEWKSRAETASARSIKACIYEAANDNYNAWNEWIKLFGSDVPL